MAEPLGLHAQRRVLPGLGVDRLDPLQPDTQGLGLPGPLGRGGPQGAELRLGVGELAVHRAVRGERRPDDGRPEGVHRLTVLVGTAEPPLVGLSVDGDEVLRELREEADGCGPATDVRPGASVARDRPDEDESVANVPSRVGGTDEGGMSGGKVEDALHDDPLGARTHQAGVAAAAEQQAETGDHHGLARPGFTGEHRQAGVQREDRFVDDPQATDADLLDHVVSPSPAGEGDARRLASPARAGRTSRPTGR